MSASATGCEPYRLVPSSWVLASLSLPWSTYIFFCRSEYIRALTRGCVYRSFQMLCPLSFICHSNFIYILYILLFFHFFCSQFFSYSFVLRSYKRLRWSRGSVLAFGTQVRGFKPGRSRRIFQGEKILLSTPSFGREVKPFVPCRRFTACKRSLNVTWKSGIFRQNSSAISRPSSPSFHY